MVSAVQSTANEPPLCVDLDGTLVRTDTLVEAMIRLLKANPLWALVLPVWLGRGRAVLKREITSRVTLEPAALPYHPELVAHLRRERAVGRRILLVTAADAGLAQGIADHLQLFDEVIASDGVRNLKGTAKQALLSARFGSGGYDYVGNSRADLPAWRAARAALVVSNDERLVRALGTVRIAHRFTSAPMRLRTWARALRLHQWVKNGLVFVPLLMAPEVRELPRFAEAVVGFLSFSLCASAVYMLNDLLDLDADRRHATKRHRPFAAGDLPLAVGFVLAPACLLASILLGLALAGSFLVVLAIYMGMTTAYSFRLKHVALLDVLILAVLYSGRIIAGAAATRVWPSTWLLGFSLFFFLSLAFVKRYSEVQAALRDKVGAKVRGYRPEDLPLIATAGTASGYISVVVAALYIDSDRVVGLYAQPVLLWLVCPLLLYWISRIWMLAHRGELPDDPVFFAISDRVSYVVGALLALILVLARVA